MTKVDTPPGVFGPDYSGIYDAVYEKKDYIAECDFVEAVFAKYNKSVKSVLDLGCGTGGHAVPLAQRGYAMTGLDRSAHMLDRAGAKAKEAGVELSLREGDVSAYELNEKFDAIISMFAVFTYLTENQSLADALACARRHLKPGGIFVFDTWYGPGVMTDRPQRVMKTLQQGNREIIRFTDPIMDTTRQVVETKFQFWIMQGDKLEARLNESHFTRFFFPLEMDYFMRTAGFDEVHCFPFMKPDDELNDSYWYMTTVGMLKGA